jgi:hypothetical protein
LSETFLIIRRIYRDIVINVKSAHVKYRYSCHILMKLEFGRSISEKYSHVYVHDNPLEDAFSMRKNGKTDRETDRQTTTYD